MDNKECSQTLERPISKHKNDINAVLKYLKYQGAPKIPSDVVEEILIQINQITSNRKVLSTAELTALNKYIQQIPTGRQRRLKQARDLVLQYLDSVCHWKLPEQEKYHKQTQAWIINLYRYSALAEKIECSYQKIALKDINPSPELNLIWTVLTFMIDVAPLPLHVWCQRLTQSRPLELINNQITVRISHPAELSYFDKTEPVSFTHYAMTPLATRAFIQYQQIFQSKKIDIDVLTKKLNAWLDSSNNTTLKTNEWQRAIQALWLHRHRLPPHILKDFSDPLRHVSPLISQKNHASSSQNTFEEDELSRALYLPKEAVTAFKDWPHNQLINDLNKKKKTNPSAPKWNTTNLLPRLLFEYTKGLIEDGGIIKDNLGPNTILRYTSFKKEFSNTPLSFTDAQDKESLHHWAHKCYDNLQIDSLDQWRMYQVFRFISYQPWVDHFDLSLFAKPTHATKVDPLVFTADDVHQIITLLLTASQSPIHSLFSVVSTLLAFYGKLRRGEVLRLRLQDIRCTQKMGQTFHLYITNTKEGKTKNRQSRWVHISMPEVGAKIIRLLIKIKKDCSKSAPLIGLNNESYTLRSNNYLLPITKALKDQFGQRARFHHLRHSGAKLYFQQSLILATEKIPAPWCPAGLPVTCFLLSKSFVTGQFHYWTENRSFSEMNQMLLFDEMGREFGHQYYATTRLHYLHGMEWIAPVFLPQARSYSRAELRFILGLKRNSNDIIRILRQLDANYAALSAKEKIRYLSTISHDRLNEYLSHRITLDQYSNHTEKLTIDEPNKTHCLNDDYWFNLWLEKVNSLSKSAFNQHYNWEMGTLFKALNSKKLTFDELSQAYHCLGRYRGIPFTKQQINALNVLGKITLVQGHEKNHLMLQCPCNEKVKRALAVLKKSSLTFDYYVIWYQNRKQVKSNKWAYVLDNIVTNVSQAEKIIIPKGTSYLEITLIIPGLNTLFLAHFKNWWNQYIAQG